MKRKPKEIKRLLDELLGAIGALNREVYMENQTIAGDSAIQVADLAWKIWHEIKHGGKGKGQHDAHM